MSRKCSFRAATGAGVVCGVAGILGHHGLDELVAMGDCLRERGPDAGAVWSEAGVGFAHQRLSVVGLGDCGAQPMFSPSGRFVLTYNGEIYNHMSLRSALVRTGAIDSWRGGSDTETLAAAIDAWGLTISLERSVGMFAVGLWDRSERVLTLARDRVGEKPLYWTRHHGRILFASQPKSFRQLPGRTPSIDPEALNDLLRYGRVPGTRTIHRDVHEVEPGTLLRFDLDAGTPHQHRWWSGLDVARAGAQDPLAVTDDDSVDMVEEVLTEAVRGQSQADVPVGAFLSGGIDSSLVVALLRRSTTATVRTFTVGFDHEQFDESPYARAVSERLETDHTEVRITEGEALAVVQRLPHIYDEPLADISQIPTVVVSAVARTNVTVALSGDGGDELFGGYPRYVKAQKQIEQRHRRYFSPSQWAKVLRRQAGASTLIGRGAPDWRIVHDFVAVRRLPSGLVLGADSTCGEQRFRRDWDSTFGIGGVHERFMAHDLVSYLPDVLLHKVDRASMAVGLETRMPMLDHRVIDLAGRLPASSKIRAGGGGGAKWVLKQLLSKLLPSVPFDRPKAGFVIPVDDWLRGPLRRWADDLLDPVLVREQGLLDSEGVHGLWDSHVCGRAELGKTLWPILMFQSWLSTRSA